jgi:hypothetical protein
MALVEPFQMQFDSSQKLVFRTDTIKNAKIKNKKYILGLAPKKTSIYPCCQILDLRKKKIGKLLYSLIKT